MDQGCTEAGGGLATAPPRPTEGAEQAARLYVGIAGREPGLTQPDKLRPWTPG